MKTTLKIGYFLAESNGAEGQHFGSEKNNKYTLDHLNSGISLIVRIVIEVPLKTATALGSQEWSIVDAPK